MPFRAWKKRENERDDLGGRMTNVLGDGWTGGAGGIDV
jgi:hypothetical protein